MDTLDRIRDMAAKQFGADPAVIDADMPIEQLGADSLGFLEFLFELEEEFNVSIEQDDAKQVRTLRALGVLIDRLAAAKSSDVG